MPSRSRKKGRSAPGWTSKFRKAGAYLSDAFALPSLPSLPKLPGLPSFRRKGPARKPGKGPSSQGSKLGRWAGPGAALALIGLGLGWKAQQSVVLSPLFPGWALWGLYLLAALLFGAGILLSVLPPGSPKDKVKFLREWFQRTKTPPPPLSSRTEWTIFALLMLVAAFFRVFRIDTVPSGMFIDQGMEGWAALRILHEGFRPLWEFDVFQNPALLLYQLAAWFLVMPVSQGTFYLFFSLMSLASLALAYWAFREIGGQRMALLGLALLAVMRWNVNFARNGFPTNQVPFYTFGTLAFLLYGVRTGKRWAFYVSAVFFATGLYTYQAYLIVPPLVLAFALYELLVDRRRILSRGKSVLAFCAISLILAIPFLVHTYQGSGLGRVHDVTILNRIQQQGSLRPLLENVMRTAVMFHWRGDGNGRHNLQDYRMLDDVTGVLFFFGSIVALATLWRKSSFYALLGFLTLCVPCLMTIDPAHANRMLGVTPFIALLAALPLASLWRLIRGFSGKWGDRIAMGVLALPLAYAGWMNFDVYFNKQANNVTSWQEYAPQETSVGRAIREHQDEFDYFLSPRYYNYYTINFLGYGRTDHVWPLLLPSGLISREVTEGRGVYFALEEGRTGLMELLKDLYPGGKEEYLVNPAGNTAAMALSVSGEELDKARGLKVTYDRPVEKLRVTRAPHFPEGLPAGPYHAVLTGNLYVEEYGDQRITVSGNSRAVLWIKGRPFPAEGGLKLEKGFHPIRVELDVADGVKPDLKFFVTRLGGIAKPLGLGYFTCFPAPRALKGSYYRNASMDEEPFLVEYDPVLNYTNGNDFSAQSPYFCRWKGTLWTSATGTYEFMVRSDNPTALRIDGKDWIPPGGAKTVRGSLTKGAHTIEVEDLKPAAYWPVFTFYWTPPGKTREVVPNSVFGEVP